MFAQVDNLISSPIPIHHLQTASDTWCIQASLMRKVVVGTNRLQRNACRQCLLEPLLRED
jgi:hypothetical protein